MSNLTLKNHSRVESIKKKFENSLNEGNKTVLSKNSTLSSFQSTEVCSFNKTIPAKNSSDVIKTETSKFDSKAQIKRTPAFRREKIECLKNHNKLPCTDISKQVGKLIKYDCGKEKSEPLPDSSLQNFQRVKTDFLNCDTENATKINSNKSNLASKKISLLANDCSKEILPYAVVNKNCNKPASKIQKETDLKLSESLRKALKLPLPKGPPPKKPPRTFCHVIPSSNSNNPTKVTEVPKDLPKLKSKLEKLENIIKTHDTKLSAKVPNEGFKASLEEKLKIIPKTIESKPLGIVPLKKNGNQNCLQLSSCINLCTDASVYEKLMQKNVCNLDLSKAEPDCNKQNPNEKSTSSFFGEFFIGNFIMCYVKLL